MRARSSIVAAGVVLLHAAASRADAPPTGAGAQLAWVRGDGADACPDEAQLRRRVVRHLARDPFASEGGAGRSFEVVVSRAGTRWLARVYERDAPDAPRTVQELVSYADGCDEIAEAAAVVVAIALASDADVDAGAAPPPRAPTICAAVPLDGERPPVSTPPSRPPAPPAPAASHGAGATLRAVGTLGILPYLAPGFGLGVDLGSAGPVRWLAGALLLAEVPGSSSAASMSYGFAALSASACLDPLRHARATLSTCATVSAGLVHAVLRDSAPVDPGQAPWVGVALGARLAVRVAGPLLLEATLEGGVSALRYRFQLRPDPAVILFEQPPMYLTGTLGAGVQF